MFLDSEVLSTDVASNDSQSPKNADKTINGKPESSSYDSSLLEVKKFNEFCLIHEKAKQYGSNDTFSNTKSDQSLLNSSETSDSSPVHKLYNRYKKVQRKNKPKKYFGVKTLQSIFSKHGGYSDISSTASDFGDDGLSRTDNSIALEEFNDKNKTTKDIEDDQRNANEYDGVQETTPQFEENIHRLLSEMFLRNFDNQKSETSASMKSVNTKKCLRVGKALRLCPNEETSQVCHGDGDQRRERLLARYVYNANCLNSDGVGDPDFGTPV